MTTHSEQDKDYIKGLLAERAGAIQAKRKERAAAVEKELKRVGYSGPLDKTAVDPVADRLETATVDPVSEKAVTKRRGKARRAPKPRAATPAEETAVAATVAAEPKPATSDTFKSPFSAPSEDAP